MSDKRLRNYWRLSMLSTGSALLIALLLLLGYDVYHEREDLQHNLTMQARLLAANVTAALVFEDDRTATEIIGTADSSPIILEAAIYRGDGSLMARFQRLSAEVRLGERAPPYGHEFSFSDLRLAVPVQLEGRTVGSIALRATLDDLYDEFGRILGSMLLILVASAVLGNYVSRKMRLQMVAAENEIERLALYDNVTGLANRHAFELGLSQALQRHARDGGGSALLFIDVDGFKAVNDQFGHPIGDQVLKALGERLGKALRAADIVARIGGDEFAAILTNTHSRGDVAHVAENLVRIAAETFDTGSGPASIGLSIGICMIPQDGADTETALRNADLAMYHAKRQGKNTHQFFSAHVGGKVQRAPELAAELGLALTAGQLYVVYQPLRAARGGRIEGLEALLRWRHPRRGIILPAEFIAVAEETGLIQDIGRGVLDLVCHDIVDLRAGGHRVPPVAVNVSRRQLDQGVLAADIHAALRKHSLTPAAIRVELTEGVFIGELEMRAGILGDLTASGIQIAVDDFGNAKPALALLRDLPASMLKVDMRLIHELPHNAETLTHVKEIIATAHASGLRVVAEGVESALQADCLTAVGCDLLQGYHVGLPIRKQDLTLLLDAD